MERFWHALNVCQHTTSPTIVMHERLLCMLRLWGALRTSSWSAGRWTCSHGKPEVQLHLTPAAAPVWLAGGGWTCRSRIWKMRTELRKYSALVIMGSWNLKDNTPFRAISMLTSSIPAQGEDLEWGTARQTSDWDSQTLLDWLTT
jgi:hypothetical protein